MEIHAYSELYLESAQNIEGHMFDFAVNEAGLDIDDYARRFVISTYAKEIERGNPSYVAGKTGPEMVKLVLGSGGYKGEFPDEVMYVDRSPEYWVGWSLAYYQWRSSYVHAYILRAVPASVIRGMYGIYHEVDITHFVEEMDERIRNFYPDTSLKRFRTIMGLSQRELSVRSGVPLRQIQLFEQRQRDISRASAITVLALSKALFCNVEDLILM